MDKRFIAIMKMNLKLMLQWVAVENLKEQGYTSDQISVVAKTSINYQ